MCSRHQHAAAAGRSPLWRVLPVPCVRHTRPTALSPPCAIISRGAAPPLPPVEGCTPNYPRRRTEQLYAHARAHARASSTALPSRPRSGARCPGPRRPLPPPPCRARASAAVYTCVCQAAESGGAEPSSQFPPERRATSSAPVPQRQLTRDTHWCADMRAAAAGPPRTQDPFSCCVPI